MQCPKCGNQENGKYCSQCGAAMSVGGPAECGSCGGAVQAGAMYCTECGAPTGHRQRKGALAYLPWILSGLALVAFAVALTLFIQGQTSRRVEGMPPTGGFPDAGAGPAVTGGGAPGGVDLSSMTPRQAADRLFDRVMRIDEAGDEAEARQFASMAIQAYGMIPPEDIDSDARFHLGLLNLVLGDAGAAEREADLILALDSEHLLGLALKARIAAARGDDGARVAAYERFLNALPAGLASGRPEYEMHDRMLETEADRAREATGRD